MTKKHGVRSPAYTCIENLQQICFCKHKLASKKSSCDTEILTTFLHINSGSIQPWWSVPVAGAKHCFEHNMLQYMINTSGKRLFGVCELDTRGVLRVVSCTV
jgi:hypothetical protein